MGCETPGCMAPMGRTPVIGRPPGATPVTPTGRPEGDLILPGRLMASALRPPTARAPAATPAAPRPPIGRL